MDSLKDEARNILLFHSTFLKQKEYWLKKLSAAPTATDILSGTGKIEPGSIKPAQIEMSIPGDLGARLIKLSKGSHLSIYIFLLSILKSLIFRYTSHQDIIVLSPVNRPGVTEQTINSLLFIRDTVDDTMTFKELVLKVRQSVLEAYENQDYPYDKLVESLFSLSAREENKPVLSTILCALDNLHHARDLENIRASLCFRFNQKGDGLEGCLFYDTNSWTRDDAARTCGHFIQLLAAAAVDVNLKISGVPILTPQERKQLVVDFNNNRRDFCRDKTVVHLLEDYARQTPEATAVVFGNDEIAYRELNRAVDRLAWHLRACGLAKDQTVGILSDRSPWMVKSILATWKAGGAYIPLEPTEPSQRILEILKDSDTRVLVTASAHLKADLEDSPGQLRVIKENEFKKETGIPPDSSGLDIEIDINSLAYVIYTSGSTGKPKGAMVEHIGMMNHIWAKIHDLQLTQESIVAQNAAHTFDISIWQFFAPLAVGGKTVIYSHELILEPDRFLAQVTADGVTVIEVVPSYLSVMLDSLDLQSWPPLPFSYLLVTGEDVKPAQLNQWFDRYPHIRVVNAYGPTEASDDITHYVMNSPPDRERIPIGKPLQNLDIYIVDKHMQLCPIGIKGEICVAGIGVGRGYLKDETRTRQVFIEDPFREEKGVRLYKTGDIGCWLPDGTIDFFGRKDYQVKIRGFRIEPGEIESKLIHHPKVKEAVVIDKEDEHGSKYLAAYLVSSGRLNISNIKQYLMERLPDYMIPAYFLELGKIPLTPNGKIDRDHLPDPRFDPEPEMPFISLKMMSQVVVSPGKIQIENNTMEEDPKEYILSDEERNRVLCSFNNTKVEYPGREMIRDLFERQVDKTPDQISAVYKNTQTTYKELNEKANRWGWALQAKGVRADKIAALTINNSIEMMAGILAILKAGGAFCPIDIEYPPSRKKFMVNDCCAQWIITRGYRDINPGNGCEIIDTDGLDLGKTGKENLKPVNQPGDLIYAAYTSGSTGTPKGTAMAHRSFLNHMNWFVKEFNINAADRVLLVTSISYELTFKNIFAPLITGGTLFIPARDYYEPGAVLRELVDKRITWINCTPGMLYKLLELGEEKELRQLSSLRYILLGGEQMSINRLIKWMESDYFNTGIVNTYGVTECSGISSYYRVKEPGTLQNGIVPLGKPIDNTELFILNKNLLPLPIGVPGELFIGGQGVGIGYLNDVRLTSEKFITIPMDGETAKTYKRVYRTGDLASWQADGNIKFLGRIDRQVNIEGLRIEPGEIENLLLKYDGIKEAVVMPGEVKESRENDDEKRDKHLCAYIVTQKTVTPAEIREYLSEELPLYMIPPYFVRLEKMPLTRNGKLDRNLLAALEIEQYREQGYQPPADEVEEKLTGIWQEVLGIEKHRISMKANFFQLGGQSLKAIMLASKIHKSFDVQLPLAEIFKNPALRKLATVIKVLTEDKYTPVEPAEKKEYYPLSPGQKRLYILHCMELASTLYNMMEYIPLPGKPHPGELETTFDSLIHRHGSLRTSFHMVNHQPVQRVHHLQEPGFKLEYYRLKPGTGDPGTKERMMEESHELGTEGYRPVPGNHILNHLNSAFDLSQAPLLKAAVVLTGPNSYHLVVVMHHITSDGVSLGILLGDFMALYRGKTLPRLKLQYKDYAEWYTSEKEKQRRKPQEMYWLKEFDGDIPVLNLALDYERSGDIKHDGAYIAVEIEKDRLERLRALEKNENVTMFMILLALFNVLFFKITGQEDIIIGTVTAGRSHADLEHIIGMFVNTLALRNYPRGDMTFRELLKKVKQRTLEAFSNQDYHLEELVEKIVGKRDIGRNPLFDVVFFFDSNREDTSEFDPKNIRENLQIRFDLNLAVWDKKENMVCAFVYRKSLFKPGTIDRFRRYFEEVVNATAKNHDILLQNINISSHLGEAKSRRICEDEIGFGF